MTIHLAHTINYLDFIWSWE